MTKDIRFPNDKVTSTYETDTVVVKYTPYENLHLRDFIKFFIDWKKIVLQAKILLRE